MKYKFTDIVDISIIQELMESQAETSGIMLAVLDPEENILAGAGWQDICAQFHRSHPETLLRCNESDGSVKDHLERLQAEKSGYHEYRCKNGLNSIAVPIFIDGGHLATLFTGQLLYEKRDQGFFQMQAKRYGFNEDAYLEALSKVPIVPRQQVQSIVKFLTRFVNLLTRMGVEKLQQLEAQKALRMSNEKFRALFHNSNDAIHIFDPTGYFLEVNQAACKEVGYTRDELLQMTIPQLLVPERAANFENRMREIQQQGEAIFETFIQCKDGTTLPVEASVRTFEYFGHQAIISTVRNISERKEANEALRRSEERFRSFFQGAGSGMAIIAPDGTVMEVNSALCEFFDIAEENILGKTVEELTHPEDRPNTRQLYLESTTRKRNHFSYEKRFLRGNGSVIWGHASGAPVFDANDQIDYFIAQIHDISDRKRAEKATRAALCEAEEARNKIEAILKSVADGLIVTDLSGRIVLMNRMAESMTGVTLGEAFTRPLETIFTEQEFLHQVAATLAGNTRDESVEWEILGPPVRTIQARTAIVLSGKKERTGAISILRDVSRERELDRMKNEFISTAAHELRTPLTSVLGFSELLLNQEEYGITDPNQQKNFLAIIREKAKRLDSITTDLLDLSRFQSGQTITLTKSSCDIGKVIRQVASLYQTETAHHLVSTSLPEKPVFISADPGKLEQVLDNLISNAIKFSPKNSEIKISGESIIDQFKISVNDEGVGMTPEQVDRIFDKFYRVDASDSAQEGLGLGMAIVKSIIEAHKGEIWVMSEPGKGTTVSFALPLGNGRS